MVFPSCSSVSSAGVGSGCVINIVYNKELPLSVRQRPLLQPRKGIEYVGDRRSCALLTRTSSSIYAQRAIMMLVAAHEFFRIDYLLYPRDTYKYHCPTFLPPSRELCSHPRYHILSSPTFAHQAWRWKPRWLSGPPIYRLQPF